MKVQENLLNEERSVCSFSGDDPGNVYSFGRDDTCGDGCNAFPQKTRQRNQRKSRVWRG